MVAEVHWKKGSTCYQHEVDIREATQALCGQEAGDCLGPDFCLTAVVDSLNQTWQEKQILSSET